MVVRVIKKVVNGLILLLAGAVTGLFVLFGFPVESGDEANFNDLPATEVHEVKEVAVPYIVVEEVPLIVEVEVPVVVEVEKEVKPEFRLFESVEELEIWLDSKPITIVSSDDWDCEDYALDLQRMAYEDGYVISTELVLGDLHMVNLARIGNKLYLIEPQSHKVSFLVRCD